MSPAESDPTKRPGTPERVAINIGGQVLEGIDLTVLRGDAPGITPDPAEPGTHILDAEHHTPPTPDPEHPLGEDTAHRMFANDMQFEAAGERLTRDRSTEKVEKPKEEKDTRTRHEQLADSTIESKWPQPVERRLEGKPLAPRQMSRKEHRKVAKMERRNRKAFEKAAESFRAASAVGATPGTRTPFFAPGTVTDSVEPGGRHASQETIRPNRYQRESDIASARQEQRLADGDYTREEVRMEHMEARRFDAAEESRQRLLEANRLDREGGDSLAKKVGRLRSRVSTTWRGR